MLAGEIESEMDEPDWTLEDHLRHGRAAVREIANAPPEAVSGPRVCFHLYPLTSDDNENWGMEAQYCQRAKREFEDCAQDIDVDYVGGHCGIEAWQDIVPIEDWLTQAIPLVWGIATKANMSFAGWSFEPRSGPYISVSQTVNVYDGNSLNELQPSAAAQSFGRLSDWLKK